MIEKVNLDEKYAPLRYGVTKRILIDFFRKVLPPIFKITFFGGIVFSMLSETLPLPPDRGSSSEGANPRFLFAYLIEYYKIISMISPRHKLL